MVYSSYNAAFIQVWSRICVHTHSPLQTESEPQEGPYIPEGRSIEEHPHIKELKEHFIKEKEELEGVLYTYSSYD